jgi:MoaA/NifB/PqqE/SkfB family radical SAM enzyme
MRDHGDGPGYTCAMSTTPVSDALSAPLKRHSGFPQPPPDDALIHSRPNNQPKSEFRDPRKNVEINVGKACNNRCVFCIDGLPKREDRSYMPWPQMKTELERWYDEGYRSVGFLGGEPTTYPKICDSVAYARELGFTRVAIATNATKLRLAHFADRILDAGLTRVTVSMHGHTAELEDKLTRVPGNFEKKCAAIRYLVHKKRTEGVLRDGLSVNIVLNGWNYRQLPRMMRFFYEKLEVDDLRVNFIRPEGYADGDADLTPQYHKVVPWLIKGIVLAETHFKKVFTFGGFPMCVLPPSLRRDAHLLSRYMGEYRDLSTACSIRSDGGDVIPPKMEVDPSSWMKGPKSSAVFFNEQEQRARFNWQDRKKLDLKGQPLACRVCELNHTCEGVWKGYLEIWGDDRFKPVRIADTALAKLESSKG